jgi:hypothetical protein
MGFLMSDTMPIEEPLLDPEGALVDIRTLARVALQSDDLAIVQKDLEIILAIVNKALRPATPEIKTRRSGVWSKPANPNWLDFRKLEAPTHSIIALPLAHTGD